VTRPACRGGWSGGRVNDMSGPGANDPTPIPASEMEAVIEIYKRDVDRTLLRENLELTPDQRVRRLTAFMRFVEQLRNAGLHPS